MAEYSRILYNTYNGVWSLSIENIFVIRIKYIEYSALSIQHSAYDIVLIKCVINSIQCNAFEFN